MSRRHSHEQETKSRGDTQAHIGGDIGTSRRQSQTGATSRRQSRGVNSDKQERK